MTSNNTVAHSSSKQTHPIIIIIYLIQATPLHKLQVVYAATNNIHREVMSCHHEYH